eukprot:453574_1
MSNQNNRGRKRKSHTEPYSNDDCNNVPKRRKIIKHNNANNNNNINNNNNTYNKNNNNNDILNDISLNFSGLNFDNCDNDCNNNDNDEISQKIRIDNYRSCPEEDDVYDEDDDISNNNNMNTSEKIDTDNNFDNSIHCDEYNEESDEQKENVHIDVLDTVFKGPRYLEDGRSLANCNLGITSKNIRFATKPHPTIKENFEAALRSYQKVVNKFCSDDKCIHRILRAKQSSGDIHFEFGMYWIYFNRYNYNDKNICIELSDLQGLIYVENGEVYVCKYDDRHEFTRRLKELLKKVDSDFPKSLLAHLGRQYVSDNTNELIIHCYCKLCDCEVEVDIEIRKKPLIRGNKLLHIQKKFNGMICIHPSGIQKQYKSDKSKLKLKDYEKIGVIFSPILTHQYMINNENIDDVYDGIHYEGIHNMNQMGNILHAKRIEELGMSVGEIEGIKTISEKMYLRDCKYHNEKPTKENRYYYGELHHFQYLPPQFAMLFNDTSLDLLDGYVVDMFMDFTENLVKNKYNLILSMVNPLGGILPYPLMEVICDMPNGYTVRISMTHLFYAKSIYTTAKWKRIYFFHLDRFKGWLYGIYFGNGYGGHHFQYLLDGVLFMKTMDNKYMLKYWFRICFGECHTMVSLATYTKNLTGSEHWKIKENKWAHSCTIMEIHRHITEALNRIDFLMNLNFMKLSLTRKIIPFDEIKDFKYYGFEDIEKMIQKGIDRNINVSLTKKKNKR